MSIFDELHMRAGWIYEALVSSGRLNDPHVAPIGVWTPENESVHMRLYGPSRTLRHALELGGLVVNFPPDECLLSTALLNPSELRFLAGTAVSAPRLRDVPAVLELEVSSVEDVGDFAHVVTTVVAGEKTGDVRLINRAGPLLVESLILASRLSFLDHGPTLETIRENSRVVRKVAPGSRYEKAMDLLQASLDSSSQDLRRPR